LEATPKTFAGGARLAPRRTTGASPILIDVAAIDWTLMY
jgi:hypothetical protein|tara:strand:+ start:842 stop:958 length:117 start_codon:yes stop_codon:yes gene_type:complete